jgi:hypothetical protein
MESRQQQCASHHQVSQRAKFFQGFLDLGVSLFLGDEDGTVGGTFGVQAGAQVGVDHPTIDPQGLVEGAVPSSL